MILVFDTETTGDKPEDRVIEIAALGGDIEYSTLVHPGSTPIDPCARAVHHITDAELVSARSAAQIEPELSVLFMQASAIAAHSAEFDVRMIKQTWPLLAFPPVICTWKCARHTWPDAPRYSNQVLRYWLGLPVLGGMPHRALDDVIVTKALLDKLLEIHETQDKLLELTLAPVLLTTCSFGKHYGTPWAQVPKDYLRWIVRNEFDADTIHTAKHWIAA